MERGNKQPQELNFDIKHELAKPLNRPLKSQEQTSKDDEYKNLSLKIKKILNKISNTDSYEDYFYDLEWLSDAHKKEYLQKAIQHPQEIFIRFLHNIYINNSKTLKPEVYQFVTLLKAINDFCFNNYVFIDKHCQEINAQKYYFDNGVSQNSIKGNTLELVNLVIDKLQDHNKKNCINNDEQKFDSSQTNRQEIKCVIKNKLYKNPKQYLKAIFNETENYLKDFFNIPIKMQIFVLNLYYLRPESTLTLTKLFNANYYICQFIKENKLTLSSKLYFCIDGDDNTSEIFNNFEKLGSSSFFKTIKFSTISYWWLLDVMFIYRISKEYNNRLLSLLKLGVSTKDITQLIKLNAIRSILFERFDKVVKWLENGFDFKILIALAKHGSHIQALEAQENIKLCLSKRDVYRGLLRQLQLQNEDFKLFIANSDCQSFDFFTMACFNSKGFRAILIDSVEFKYLVVKYIDTKELLAWASDSYNPMEEVLKISQRLAYFIKATKISLKQLLKTDFKYLIEEYLSNLQTLLENGVSFEKINDLPHEVAKVMLAKAPRLISLLERGIKIDDIIFLGSNYLEHLKLLLNEPNNLYSREWLSRIQSQSNASELIQKINPVINKYMVVIKLDNFLIIKDKFWNEHVNIQKLFKKHGLFKTIYINMDEGYKKIIRYLLFPGAIEMLRLLHAIPNIKLGFVCNDKIEKHILEQVLLLAIGKEVRKKNNYKIVIHKKPYSPNCRKNDKLSSYEWEQSVNLRKFCNDEYDLNQIALIEPSQFSYFDQTGNLIFFHEFFVNYFSYISENNELYLNQKKETIMSCNRTPYVVDSLIAAIEIAEIEKITFQEALFKMQFKRSKDSYVNNKGQRAFYQTHYENGMKLLQIVNPSYGLVTENKIFPEGYKLNYNYQPELYNIQNMDLSQPTLFYKELRLAFDNFVVKDALESKALFFNAKEKSNKEEQQLLLGNQVVEPSNIKSCTPCCNIS